MFLTGADGYKWNDKEGADKHYRFDCQLSPATYSKLLFIIHNHGIITFDISTAINYVIENFPEK